MTTEKVNDLELVQTKDYFDAYTFRIVPADAASFGSSSEVPVIINIHADFVKKLNFNHNSLQELFAFARLNPKLIELNGAKSTSKNTEHKIQTISLNDCGTLFTMVIDFTDGSKKLYSLKSSEVQTLLNDCRHPNIISNEF